jgi:hypothetical protein
MNSYGSKFPLLFAPAGVTAWAITLGQHTWFSVPEAAVDPAWQRHEDCHKKQWRDEGYLKFASRYLWQLVTKGYQNIDYEVQARAAADAGVVNVSV